jgi:DNA-binding GntR family transcriptional regulator
LAVQYLITRASSANLDELETLVQQMADKIEEGVDPGDAAELDLAFHHALCRISGHRRALAAWEALSGQTRMLLLSRFKLRPQDFQQLAVEWHGRLVDALRQRDLPLAQEELSKHLGMTLKSVLHSGQEAE